MLEDNAVNAAVEEVVTPQETTEVAEQPTESVETEVAPVAEEEPKQTKEENAKFAEIRRKYEAEKAEAAQKARDKFIEEQFGKTHNIHTEAEYNKAIAEQKQNELLKSLKDGDVDPKEIYEQMKANDPEFKQMKESREKAYINEQVDVLNNELKDLGLDVSIKSLEDIAKLDNSDSVIEYVNKGMTLSEAYFLANKQTIIQADRTKIQQETIEKISANGDASPGSLSDTGDKPTFFTREQVDAMSQSDVNKNLDLIHKSMKSW